MNPAIENIDVPAEFVCPISTKLIVYPLMAKSGQTYDRDGVIGLLQENGHVHCPITNQVLTISDLVPNRLLEIKIRIWRRRNGMEEHIAVDSDSGALRKTADLSYVDSSFSVVPCFFSSSCQDASKPRYGTADQKMITSRQDKAHRKLFKEQRKQHRILAEILKELEEI